MSLKLAVDNSKKFWDAGLEEYTDDPNPTEYPYMINNDEGELIEMFTTWLDAAQYQFGMGWRATTTIEHWEK